MDDCVIDDRNNLPKESNVNSQDQKLDRSNSRNSTRGKCAINGSFLQDSMDAANAMSSLHIANDGDKISQGIILNAAHFVSSDGKELNFSQHLESGENICEPKLEDAQGDEANEPRHPMTIMRKIAFGVSFFPSVLFILCFAVILPCNEYDSSKSCVQEKWFTTLNQTDLTAELLVKNQILLGYRQNSTGSTCSGILSLGLTSKDENWRLDLDSAPKTIDCSIFDANADGITDCLTTVAEGAVYAFNLSDGDVFWKYNGSEADEVTSPSLVLPGCGLLNDSGSITIATISSEILRLVFIDGTDRGLLKIKNVTTMINCTSSRLMAWKHENVTDLVYLCKDRNDFGSTWLLKQEDWCSLDVKMSNGFSPPLPIRLDVLPSESSIFPTSDGILVWGGSTMALMQENSTRWLTRNHSSFTYRNARYGRFYPSDQQIALVQDSAFNGSAVVVLNITDGDILKSWQLSDGQVADIAVLHGKDRDYVLVASILKLKSSGKENVVVGGVAFADNFTTESFVEYSLSNVSKVSEERGTKLKLVLLQYDEKTPQKVLFTKDIKFPCNNGGSCIQELQSFKIIASTEDQQQLKKLDIVLSQTYSEELENGEETVFTKLDVLEFENWDSSDENYLCK